MIFVSSLSRLVWGLPLLLLTAAASVSPLGAQPVASILAGAGYTGASPSVAAAPGQILVLSVYGIKTNLSGPLRPDATVSGPVYSLGGISVDFVQGLLPVPPGLFTPPPVVTPVELRGIQQGYCAISESCTTITSITLQVPSLLGPSDGSVPVLRVRENGQLVGSVMLRPTTDNVHVLNTCDQTLISISAATSIPQDVCAPVALVRGKINSLYNLIHGGEAVEVWAYGLGALANDAAGPDSQLQQHFRLSFDFRPNAPASSDSLSTTTPLFAGYVGGGTYQVNFVVPPVPAGVAACDGTATRSNLTVTLSGPQSSDAVQLCVAP